MNKILKKQLEILTKKYPFETDGVEGEVSDDFSQIVFKKGDKEVSNDIKVIFESYFVTGFPGFDFHDKWNNGVAPFDKVMYGKILKETEKMYYLELHTETNEKQWTGWCPKKSCTIK